MAVNDQQHPWRRKCAGFTLIEIAMVLLIVGLIMGMVLQFGGGIRDARKRQAVVTQLATLDAALASFVAVNKRLPCPANGALANAAAGAGAEMRSAAGTCNPANQANGVVPWVTLGLTGADALDPWNGRITYRVDPQLAGATPRPLLMNMSNCDPSATGAADPATGACKAGPAPCVGSVDCTTPSAFLANKGIDVWDGQNGATGFANRQNNAASGSGAAYVLISHGPSGAGAYNSVGNLQPGMIVLGLDEVQNANGQALAMPATQATVYRNAPLNENDELFVPSPPVTPPPPARTLVHFDDYLSHPTIMTVLNKANLGPRAR